MREWGKAMWEGKMPENWWKIRIFRGLLSCLNGKEPPCQCRKTQRHGFHPWVWKIPWRRKWQPTPVLLPGKIPWTGEPGGLQFIESQRVGYNWACSTWKCLDSGITTNPKPEKEKQLFFKTHNSKIAEHQRQILRIHIKNKQTNKQQRPSKSYCSRECPWEAMNTMCACVCRTWIQVAEPA